MDCSRRQFLSTTSATWIGTAYGSSVFGHAAGPPRRVNDHWPTPGALFAGLLRPLKVSLPRPQRMFGADPRRLLDSGTTPLPGELDVVGRYFAAFLRHQGPQRARNGGRALPMLHPGRHSVGDSIRFYQSLLAQDAVALSRRGQVDCPWCDRTFGGLAMLVRGPGEFQYQATCCDELVHAAANLPPASAIVIDEEISTARWRYLLDQLSGLIAAVLADPDGRINPGGRPALTAVVEALPDFLDRQPWQQNTRPDGRARRGDFPASTLPESSQGRPRDDFATEAEIEHFVRFCSAAVPESIPVEENGGQLHRLLFERSESALLAEAFGAVADGLDDRTRTRVRGALRRQFCLIRHLEQPGGNFPGHTWPNSLSLAIASGDDALFRELLELVRHYLHNHFHDDGMSVEGSFNYAAMLCGFYLPAMRDRLGAGVWEQMISRRPLLNRFAEIGCYPIRTLRGIESQHADEHLGFFRSAKLALLNEPDYEGTESSRCFPGYGIGCLRAGRAGARMEAIMDFRSNVLHTHSARLNVQLFFEGVSLMPELGYAAPSSLLPPDKVPDQMRRRLPLTEMRPWFANALEMHCAPTIDGHLGNSPHGVLEGWFAKGGANDPGAGFRFMEVNLPPENFADYPGDIEKCGRQWMLVNLPDGNAVAVSVCRLSGGRRHDLWWHFPAPPVQPCAPVVEQAADLYHHLRRTVETPPPFARALEDRGKTFGLIAKKSGRKGLIYGEDSRELKKVRVWTATGRGMDQHRWQINPAEYVVDDGRASEPWLQSRIEVRLWSAATGSKAQHRYLGSRAPWPGLTQLGKYREGTLCRADALDVFTEQRHATDERRLDSTFINVLAAHHPEDDSSAPVRSARVIENVSSPAASPSGAGVEIGYGSGRAAMAVLTTAAESGVFLNQGDGFELRGRAGKACPESMELVLSDGELLRAYGMEVRLSPGWNAPLSGLIGDLTGQPESSALLLDIEQALPSVLIGTRLVVEHAANPSHQSSYEISAVSTTPTKQQRVDLAGNPPFALADLRITARSARFVRVREHQRFAPNRAVSFQRIAYFPSADFTARQIRASASGSGKWATTAIHFDRELPPSIQPGDPLILYSIQRDDRVRIPSAFACRRVGREFLVESTGDAELRLPGSVRFTNVPDRIKVSHESGTTRLQLAAGRYSIGL